MPSPSNKALLEENARLEADLIKTRKIQEDLWTHEIYLNARKKMSTGLAIVLALVSIVGAGSIYELSRRAVDSVIEKVSKPIIAEAEIRMKKEMVETVNTAIVNLIAAEKKRMEDFVNTEISILVRNMETDVDVAKHTIDEELAALENRVKTLTLEASNSYSKRIEQIQTGLEQKNANKTNDVAMPRTMIATRAGDAGSCDPLSLSEDQKGVLSIEQQVIETDRFADDATKKQRYYQNSFSLAAREDAALNNSKESLDCLINSVDRVVYTLDKRWFAPFEVVRIEPNDRFGYSANVWGRTKVSADVYLKGNWEPIKFEGVFQTTEVARKHLEKVSGPAAK